MSKDLQGSLVGIGFVCVLFFVWSPVFGGEWLPEEIVCPMDPSIQLTSDASHRCVAVDGLLRVHVVWEDWDRGIMYNRRVQGEGWDTECFEVSLGTQAYYMEDAAVCSDSEGNVFVAWSEARFPNPYHQIYYREYRASSGWDSTDAMLDNPVDRSSYAPSVAMDDSGHVHLVWLRDYEIWNRVLYRKYVPGVGWTGNKKLSEEIWARCQHPVVVEHEGSVHAVWDQLEISEGRHIYYRRYTPGAGWDSVATKVNVDYSGSWPSLTVDQYSNVHVVWTVWFSDLEQEVAYRRWTPGVGWDPDVFYVTENDSARSEMPAVACDISGDIHVVWEDYRDSGMQVYERVYDLVSGWGDETNLSGTEWAWSDPHLSADFCGNLHLVWSDSRSLCCDVYYMMWDGQTALVGPTSGDSHRRARLNITAHPNPFTSEIAIQCQIAPATSPLWMAVDIYDPMGRLVRRLMQDQVSDQAIVVWDGHDDSGKGVAPGTYFCIASTRYQRHVGKIVLVR